jgi:hypothetical protein
MFVTLSRVRDAARDAGGSKAAKLTLGAPQSLHASVAGL